MGARFRSWWQKIRKHLVMTTIFIVVCIAIFITVAYLLNWEWSGFNTVHTRIWTIGLTKTSNGKTIFQIEEQQQAKTLWDWLELLIIPAVLAIAGYVINLTISRGEQEAIKQRVQSERETAEKRSETEREIALDNQREAALQAYIDKLSELLVEKRLRESKPIDEVRKIGRVRTLTVLPHLDDVRKKSVLQFLHETGLIDKETSIIDLNGADLRDADFRGADLRDADLHDAILSGADFSGANLSGADLSYAIFRDAIFNGADLRNAKVDVVKLKREAKSMLKYVPSSQP
jgi:hypothetical protein